MKVASMNVRKNFVAILTTAVLSFSILVAAWADGPGGLGKLPPLNTGSIQSDGSIVYTNGIVLESDKRICWHDANSTVWIPITQQDGSKLYQDGTILHPDGSITYPPDN